MFNIYYLGKNMAAYGFRPSQRFFYKKLLQFLLAGLLMIFSSGILGMWIGEWLAGPDGMDVVLRLTTLINLVWLIPVLATIYPYSRNLFYEIHDDKVVRHSGVLTRRVIYIPIHMITSLEVLRGPLDRIFGLGTLRIRSVSFNDFRKNTIHLVGIQDYKGVHDRLTIAIKRHLSPTSVEVSVPISLEIEMFKDLRLELWRIRHILEALSPSGNRTTVKIHKHGSLDHLG
jgi:membrane protein YdbS with pleckstrin-like domain